MESPSLTAALLLNGFKRSQKCNETITLGFEREFKTGETVSKLSCLQT